MNIIGYIIISKNNSDMKAILKNVFYLIFTIGIISCANNPQRIHNETETISLSGEEMHESSDYLGGFTLDFSEDTLFQLISYSDYIFSAATLQDDSLVLRTTFGKRGNGPHEMIKGNIIRKNDGNLLIVDSSVGFISKIYELAPTFIHDCDKWTEYKIGAEECLPGGAAVSLNDSCLLMLTAPLNDVKSIMSIIDYKHSKVTQADFWPEDGYEGATLPKFMVYMSNAKLFANSDGKILYHCGNSDLDFIFTVENGHIDIKTFINDEYPKYTAATDGINYSMSLPNHEYRAFATDDYIYLLNYNKSADGNAAKDYKQLRYGDEVDVYDWNGKKIKKLILEKGGYSIIINSDDSHLFLCSNDEETGDCKWINYELK